MGLRVSFRLAFVRALLSLQFSEFGFGYSEGISCLRHCLKCSLFADQSVVNKLGSFGHIDIFNDSLNAEIHTDDRIRVLFCWLLDFF